MITAGIDMGAKTVKVILLKYKLPIAKSLILGGLDTKTTAETALNETLKKSGLSRDDIANITATGAGRKEVSFADEEITEVRADARGATFIFPSVRTVIDVGAEESRGIRCDSYGKVIDFATNEKCAAGAGSFTEAMARALEVNLEDLGPLSLKSTKTIPMNAQCTVFAESEVVTLVHDKIAKEDIARAVLDAIASRITAMVSRVGLEKDATLIGGVAKNVGFVESLKRNLGVDLLIPEDPEFIGALGAALIATENSEKNKL